MTLTSESGPQDSLYDPLEEAKGAIRDFLSRIAYTSPRSPCDVELRKQLDQEIASWPSDINPAILSKIQDACCVYAETTCGHTSLEHRLFVAVYTACIIYVDDLGERQLDAVMRFTGRFARGEPQPDPVLDRLADMLRRSHELWTPFGADAIIAGTLDAVTATYIECTTQDMLIKPSATRFPYYLRTRASYGQPFIHFLFMQDSKPETYIQLLPYLEHWTLGTNDILSFYKEELAGEVNNYIHLRAACEQTSTAHVLHTLVQEVLETTSALDALTAEDAELAALWQRYRQGNLEFTLKAKRYRLAELGFEA